MTEAWSRLGQRGQEAVLRSWRGQRPRVGQARPREASAAYYLVPAQTGNSASWVVRLRRTMLTRKGLLLAALLSQGSALLTGIAARRGTVNVQANLVGTARLFWSDIALKV